MSKFIAVALKLRCSIVWHEIIIDQHPERSVSCSEDEKHYIKVKSRTITRVFKYFF